MFLFSCTNSCLSKKVYFAVQESMPLYMNYFM